MAARDTRGAAVTGTVAVYGYVRSSLDQASYVAACQDKLRAWCERERWQLGAIFTDMGAPLDGTDRIGFRGLLDALSLPIAAGVVIVDAVQLSPREEIATSLVRQIRATGAALLVLDGDLPEAAERLCAGQPLVHRLGDQ